MKYFLTMIVLWLATQAIGQNRTSVQNGNWDDINTWGGLSVPDQTAGSFGVITLNNTVTVRASVYSSSTPLQIDQVVINGSGSLVIEAGAYFRIQNGAGNDITVNSTGTIFIDGVFLTNTGVAFSGLTTGNTSFSSTAELRASSVTIPTASGYNLIPVFLENVTTALSLDASWNQLTSSTDLTVNCPSLGNNAISFNGNITQLHSLLVTSTNGSNGAGGGRVIVAAPAVGVTTNINITGDITVDNDSRIFLSNGSAAGFLNVDLAGNLNFNSASSGSTGFSQLAIGAGSVTVNFNGGNFSMGSGDLRLISSGSAANAYLKLNAGGNITVTGGTISENGTGTSQGSISFLGNGTSQTFNVDPSFIGSGSSINLTVNKSSGSVLISNSVTLSNTTLTSGDIILVSGNTFSTTAATLSSGNFILSGASFNVLTGALAASNAVIDATVPSSVSVGATGSFSGALLFKDGSVLTSLSVSRTMELETNPSSGNVTVATLNLTKGTLTKSLGSFSISDQGLITSVAGTLSLGSPITPLGVYDLTYNNTAALTTGGELSSSLTAIRNFTMQGTSVLTLDKDLTVNGTFLLSAGTFTASSFSTTLNGSTNTISSGANFAALNVNGALSQATATSTKIAGNLVIGPGGSLNFSAGTASFNGTTIITNNGSLTPQFSSVSISGSLTAPSGNLNISGNLGGNGSFNNNGGTIVFNGTTIASGSGRSFFNLTVDNGASLSGTSSFTITGNLVNNGTMNFTAGTLTWNSTGSFSGSPISTSLFGITVASTQTLNLTLDADLILLGNLTLTGGLNHSTTHTVFLNGNMTGNGAMSSSGTFDFTGATSSMTSTSVRDFTNLTVSGTLTVGANTSYTLTNGLLTVSGTLNTLAANTASSVATMAGNTTLVSTGTSTTFNSLLITGTFNASGTLNLNKNFTNNGTFNVGSASISFTSPLVALAQAISGTSSSTFNDVNVNTASTLTISKSSTIQGTLTLNSGITNNTSGLLAAASGINVIRNGTATMTGLAPSSGPYNVTYNGSSYSNGVELLGNVTDINSNLTGTLTFVNPITASGTLTVSAGVVDCGSNAVSIGSLNCLSTFIAPNTAVLTLTGDFTNSGVFNDNSGTVNMAGSNQNIGGSTPTTFYNIVFGGTATKTLNTSISVLNTFSINTGVNANLGTITSHTASYLILGGVLQNAPGSWGSSSSGASHTNDAFFSNSGLITIANGGNMYYTRANGNWDSSSTWSTIAYGNATNSGTFPVAGDLVFIGGGYSVTVASPAASAAVTFDNVAMTGVNNTLSINSGNPLTISGSVTIPQMTGGLNKLDAGDGTLNTQNIDFTNGTLGGTGHRVTISTGTVTVDGNISGTGTSSAITFSGTGLLQLGGAIYTSTQGSLTTITGSTVEYNGANQTVQALGYNNLTLSGSGTKSLAATTTVSGNLAIGDNVNLTVGAVGLTVSKTTTIGGGASGSLSITSSTGAKTFVGLVTINSGGTWSNTTSAVTFRGGISNSGTFTAGTGTHTFNTNSQVLTGTFVIPGVTVTGAAVSLTNTNSLTVNTALSGTGTLIQNSNATLSIGGTSLIANVNALAAGNTVNYVGGNQTVHGNSYMNLGLSGVGTKTLQVSTTTIGGNLVLSGTVSITAVAGLSIGGFVNIGSGCTFTSGSFTHQVAGDFTNNGSFVHSGGTVNFSGVANQFVLGSSATTFNNINITNAGGVVSVESNQNLQGVLTLSPGATFDADGSSDNSIFTLLSTNDSPAQDASIGPLPSSANINGSVTVQRYMSAEPAPASPLTTFPLGIQGIYRYISSPVTTATVSQWQSSFSITGNFLGASTTDPSSGTDTVCGVKMKPASASMFYWNEPTQKFLAYPTSNSSAPLVNGTGYSAFVRNCSTPTIVTVTGPIYNASTTPFDFSPQLSYLGSGTNKGFTLVGNPFPSAIDWGSATGWNRSGISPVIAITDNGGTGNGTLRYLDETNGAGQYIASGQAFWVRSTGAGSTLQASETVKTTGGSFQFYRGINPTSDKLEISITNGQFNDQAVYKLNALSNPSLDDLDGPKLDNARLNLSTFSADRVKMAINSTNELSCSSTISMDISIPGTDPQTNRAFSIMPDGNYRLNFSMNGKFKSYVLILYDAYLNVSQNLSQNPTYTFAANRDKSGSNLANRFMIRLSDQMITLDNTVDSDLKICGSDQAIIELKNPMGDLRYFASIKGKVVSDTLIGSGSALQFAIESHKLEIGIDTIVFKAIGKCNTYTLNNISIVTHDDLYIAKSMPTKKCSLGSVVLSSAGAPQNGTYYWYLKPGDITPIFVGSNYHTPVLTKTETYYVSAVNALGCAGTKVPVTANIVDLPPASIQVQSDLVTLQSNYHSGNQWFVDDILLEGAVNQTIIPSKSGSYTVKVSDQGCSILSEPLMFMMTDREKLNDINPKYYPNPTDGVVNFEVKLHSETVGTVVDNLGRVVGKIDFTNVQDGNYLGKYDFRDHSSGIYFVRIPDSDNTVRLIKVIRK